MLKVQNWEYKYKVQIQNFPHGERQPQSGSSLDVLSLYHAYTSQDTTAGDGSKRKVFNFD